MFIRKSLFIKHLFINTVFINRSVFACLRVCLRVFACLFTKKKWGVFTFACLFTKKIGACLRLRVCLRKKITQTCLLVYLFINTVFTFTCLFTRVSLVNKHGQCSCL